MHPEQQVLDKYREQSWRHDLAHSYYNSLFLHFAAGKIVTGIVLSLAWNVGL